MEPCLGARQTSASSLRPAGRARTSEAPPGPEKPFWLGHHPSPTSHSSARLWLTSAAVLSPTFGASERKGCGRPAPSRPCALLCPSSSKSGQPGGGADVHQGGSRPRRTVRLRKMGLRAGGIWDPGIVPACGDGPFGGLSPASCKATWAWDHQDSALTGSSARPPLALGPVLLPAVPGRWAAHLRPPSRVTGRPGASLWAGPAPSRPAARGKSMGDITGLPTRRTAQGRSPGCEFKRVPGGPSPPLGAPPIEGPRSSRWRWRWERQVSPDPGPGRGSVQRRLLLPHPRR